jgi:hypothetical protein
MSPTQSLSNLQLELLKVFSIDLSEDQLIEIRDLLSRYFAEKATAEMNRLWEEKGWSMETIENWANEHMRTASRIICR